MQVALLKLTARRTSTSLVDEAEEFLASLPESPDMFFDRLAEIIAKEVEFDALCSREIKESEVI